MKHLSSRLEALKKSYSELEGKAEGYLVTMKRDKEEHARMEELLRGEMAQHVSAYWSLLPCTTSSSQCATKPPTSGKVVWSKRQELKNG